MTVVGGLPSGVVPTFDQDSGTSNPDGIVTVHLTTNVSGQRFGYRVPPVGATGSIGDRVWLDRDGDGVQDAGEPGLSGVTVTLRGPGGDGVFGSGDDVVVETTRTGVDGAYLFAGLVAGKYQVVVGAGLPAGVTNTGDPDGVKDSKSQVTLAAGQPTWIRTSGIGCRRWATGSIGDRVWLDADGDGVQDAGEPGLAGVTVTLRGPGGDGVFGSGDDVVVATTRTGVDGVYLFAGLVAGKYQVVVGAGLPARATNTGDPDGVKDSKSQVTLTAGQSNLDQGLRV